MGFLETRAERERPVPPDETTTPPHGDPLRSGEDAPPMPPPAPGVPPTEPPSGPAPPTEGDRRALTTPGAPGRVPS